MKISLGILFIKMGQYSDAAASFEFIMSEQRADLKSGLHLILCYYALGDIEKMVRSILLFIILITVLNPCRFYN